MLRSLAAVAVKAANWPFILAVPPASWGNSTTVSTTTNPQPPPTPSRLMTFRRRDWEQMQLTQEVRTEDGAVGAGVDQKIFRYQGPIGSLHISP